MSPAAVLLGLDLGTGSAKAVVTSPDGQVLASARAPYPVSAPQPGWAETDPEQWWSAAASAAREAVTTAARPVAAVGLSGQMHGVVLASGSGEPLRPAVLHLDTRAEGHLARLHDLGDAALRRLANPLGAGMAAPVLLWLSEHEPQAYAAAVHALQPKDWLRLRLTGEAATEPSDASATLLFDVAADRWDDDVVTRLGLRRDLLAPLLPHAGTLAGRLTAPAAAALGLPAGTPVAAGGGDTAVGAVGAGVHEPGRVLLTVGSSGQAVTPLAAPRPSPGVHLYRSATPAGWYALGAVLNAGVALDWVRRLLAAGWDELYAAAEVAPSETDPLFLPHLNGERTPYQDPGLRGAWSGLGLGHDRGTLLRSALEGVALGLREALDALPAGGEPATDVPGDAGEVLLAGGGSEHPAWRQLLADVLQRPLRAVEAADASGRGAALLGGVAADVVGWDDVLRPPRVAATATRPDDRAAERTRRRLHRYAAAVAALRDAAAR